MVKEFKDDISIVLCGEAGQGIQTVESILVKAIKMGGYNVFSSKEYMSRVRGGENSTQIRVSSRPVQAYVERIDILVALSEGALSHLKNRISDETIIICDNELPISSDFERYNIIKAPFIETAKEIGGPIFSNVIAAGTLSCILDVDKVDFDKCITAMFARKGEKILEGDLRAGTEGYLIGKDIIGAGKVSTSIPKDPSIAENILINGIESFGMGCIAGGCRFMSSYPMTPSSGLQIFIAQQAHEFEMVFEQAEDEIAAINMALGASYAGARSLVATSGSGFALMVEAVGLAGMIETPVVIYVGQRPGPAVGLPTRTAQEDLDLVLYAGPGEFPRIIFAPGNFQDAMQLSAQAFNLADKYQIPVFILSDQFMADIYYNIPDLDLDEIKVEDYVVKSEADYIRYQLTPDGVSPRAIPGYGDGLVLLDADEHDETGHITEDLDIRTKMVNKRLKKMDKILEDVVPPELISINGTILTEESGDYDTLIIGWGSTYGPIIEAMELLDKNHPSTKKIAFLYFKQVYPLAPYTKKLLEKAKRIIIFENNAKGQFANLIKLQYGLEVNKKVLKYNGMPFSVEEVLEVLKNLEEV